MQSNIYAQKENGDLRLVAEIEGESDPALAVDALLDEMPRLKQRSFVVIDLDNVMVVEAEDEIVQPRRKITVTSNGTGQAVVETEDEDEAEAEPVEVEAPVAEEAPKPRRGRPRGAATSPPKRRPGRPRGSKNAPKEAANSGGSKKSPFKANPASAE